MGLFVKETEEGILTGADRLCQPGSDCIFAANFSVDAALDNGWKFIAQDIDVDSLTPVWVQPSGASDAYPRGALVRRNYKTWRSVIDANVWAPEVTGWVEQTSDESPAWRQPLGAHDAYLIGQVVSHNSKLWKSLIDANVWEPSVSGWREIIRVLPDVAAAPPEWVQPTGAQDAYQIGDLVTYQGQVWRSTAANNVWAPGVYGWVLN